MDFMSVLNVAQNNRNSNQSAAYYATKFNPPKKESKQPKNLSQNIKKFLSRKEEEEKQRAIEEHKKKQNLLALRDVKTQKRINRHLRACKDSDKSVLIDEANSKRIPATSAGISQPVTDDYGYVSQEASAFHDKLMEKYKNMPAEKSLFSSAGKKTVKDIESTKERVKAAIKQEKSGESRSHRVRSEKASVPQIAEEEKKYEKAEKEKNVEQVKSKKKVMPPPINFSELLKLAEQKQHEPVVVKVIPKKKEPEKLMTGKEYAKEKEYLVKKEDRRRSTEISTVKKTSALQCDKVDKKILSKPEILNGFSKTSTEKEPKLKPSVSINKPLARSKESSESSNSKIKIDKTRKDKGKDSRDTDKYKEKLLEERKKLEMERRQLEEMRRTIEEEKKKLSAAKEKNKIEQKSSSHHLTKISNKIGNSRMQESGNGNSKLIRDKILLKQKKDIKPKKIISSKRRIVDDDEDEYDSELDDFIAEESEEEGQDYSKYISEIFGYDKRKYKDVDEDDSGMESNFAQQLKEEFVSTKMGIMEDLEDIRKEANEKKRKAMLKKKRRID